MSGCFIKVKVLFAKGLSQLLNDIVLYGLKKIPYQSEELTWLVFNVIRFSQEKRCFLGSEGCLTYESRLLPQEEPDWLRLETFVLSQVYTISIMCPRQQPENMPAHSQHPPSSRTGKVATLRQS